MSISVDELGGTIDRRTFVRSTAVAGSGLAAGITVVSAQDDVQEAVQDPVAPPGLGPTAQLDNRFPITYRSSVPHGVRVLMEHFEALSRREPELLAQTLHFPFGSFEEIRPVVTESMDSFMRTPPASLNVLSETPRRFTDRDGYLKPGAYDVFVHLEVINCDPTVAALAMTYDRYDDNGKLLLRCDGVYSVTNNDGRWGIQLMSTIFTPAEMIGQTYSQTIEAAKRVRVEHDLAYQQSDREVDAGTFQLGTSLGIRQTGGTYRAAPEGRSMERFRISGITDRLSVRERTEEDVRRDYYPREEFRDYYEEYRDVFPGAGVGEWGWVIGLLPRSETRVIHHDYHKAHVSAGAARFTAAGEVASLTHDLAVITYRRKHWARAAGLSYTTRHDRANDLRPGPGGAGPRGII